MTPLAHGFWSDLLDASLRAYDFAKENVTDFLIIGASALGLWVFVTWWKGKQSK